MTKRYQHKLSGEILTLKKDYGSVASFYSCNKTVIYNVICDTCVCQWDNVIQVEKFKQQQKILF